MKLTGSRETGYQLVSSYEEHAPEEHRKPPKSGAGKPPEGGKQSPEQGRK